MRSGRRTLHSNTPMPGGVGRRHEDPKTSDNFGFVLRIAKEPIGADGIRAGDCNVQAAWSHRLQRFVTYGGHWKHPKDNGYTHVKRRLRRGTRPMNKRELARKDWTWEQLRRCRRPNGERPRTTDELLTYAVLHGVVLIFELKHHAYTRLEVMQAIAAEHRRHDHPSWVMVLITLEPRDKVAAARRANVQIALIFGHDPVRRPDTWAHWPQYPNQIWGPDSAKRWLPA